MKRNWEHIVLLISILLLPISMMAQRITISGYVSDAESGERLIGAAIYDTVSHQGAVTNTAGFYTLSPSPTLPTGERDKIVIQASYVGYHPSAPIRVATDRDTVISIALRSATRLEEVLVTGSKSISGPESAQMSAIEVPVTAIQNIPAIGGEVDVLKAIQLLPGVQSGNEGSAGIYVRGGGPDENLILLDGVPLYNVNHAMGMFSVFNADAIKNVTLYKGNFPARFGSRLSSVIDVRQNDGNSSFWHGGITVGLLAAKLNVEGPIFGKAQLDSLKQGFNPRAKTTFNISARRTYFDLFMSPIIGIMARMEDDAFAGAGYYFYDVNAKVTHTFSDQDRLSASFYIGDDALYMRYTQREKEEGNKTEAKQKLHYAWGNLMAAVNWEHRLNAKMFQQTMLSFTRYRYTLRQTLSEKETGEDPYTFEQKMTYSSQIHDLTIQHQTDYSPNSKHDMKFGASYTFHHFRPSIGNNYLLEWNDGVAPGNNSNNGLKMDTTLGGQRMFGHEAAIYYEDTYSPWQWLRLNLGARASIYGINGKVYPSFEPRVGLRALLYKDLAFKASYSYMSQYIHLLSNSSVSMPTDLWVPVTKEIPPMRSMQVAAGLSYDILGQAEISVEGYYKQSKNLLEYQDGATFMGSATDWQDKVIVGNGWSYGIELLLQRKVGPVTGWLGYTWSRAMRQFDEINYGKPFHAKYEREHDLSLTLQYNITPLIDIAGTFVYATGNRATLSTQTYYDPTHPNYNNNSWTYPPQFIDKGYDYIGERYNFRMPDYHRLDLSVNFHIPHSRSDAWAQTRRGRKQDPDKRKTSRGGWLKDAEHIVNLSVYNVYNHKNPYLLYRSGETLHQMSLFPIMPSFSYHFKF